MSEETPLPSSSIPEGEPHREKTAASAVESEANIESFDSEASSPDSASSLPPDDSFQADDATIVGDAVPSLQVIGDFEIHDKLGQGGMGSVYRARQISLDRWVALKILPASLEADDTFVTRFQREARIAASLNHRNLVRVYSSGQADGCHYIAMELVEGETLGQWLKRGGALPPPEALRVCLDVARALEAGWQNAHLIHRDIKPGNIFLSHDGEVKVGDLGLAKSMSSDTTGLTHTGTAMGTPHYISPEQARGDKDLDFRADIYSLGCTLFQMLTGRTPYEGRDPVSVMHQHIHAPPPAILKLLPQCPIPLARLVGKMLKKIKRERQSSYEELIAQIESVQALFAPAESPLESTLPPDPDATLLETPGAFATPRSATPVTASVVRATVAPPQKKSPAPLIAGLGIVVLAIGAAAFFLTSGKDRASSQAPDAGTSATVAPAPAPAKWTNLLDLVDPARDGINGGWKIENGELISAKAAPWSLCVLPVNNGSKNFDLRYRVTRGEGSGIGMFFPFRRDDETGGDVIFDFGSPNVPKLGGIEKFGDRRLSDTGIKRDMWLPKGQECAILVQVRDEGVAVQLNGEEVFRRTGDWSQFRQRGGADDELFRKLGNRPVFGVGLFNSQATYHAIEMREVRGDEGRTLPEAPKTGGANGVANAASNTAAENWQNVLRDDGQTLNVSGSGGARFTPEGLRLGKNATATVRATAPNTQRDGGLRARFLFDGARPGIVVRANDRGLYALGFKDFKTLWMYRYDKESGKNAPLKEFALPKPLSHGEAYELEVRIVGSTLTAKFQGAVLGSAEDSTFPAGSFGFNNYANDAPEVLLQSLEFLDLDAASSGTASAGEWKPMFTKDSPPPPGTNNSVEFRDGLLVVGRGSVLVPQPTANAAIRARVRITEDTGYPALILRSTGADYYKVGIGRERRSMGMTYFHGGSGYDVLGRQEFNPLPVGSTVELEFRIFGSEITALLNGRQVFSATDTNLTAPGKWGISADALASFESVEGRSLALAPGTVAVNSRSEDWQTLPQNNSKSLDMHRGVQVTPQGLLLSSNAAATIRLGKFPNRDGAVRARLIFGDGHPQLSARSHSRGAYNVRIENSKTITILRWDGTTNQSQPLKEFSLQKPLVLGQAFDLELRMVGKTLTTKLDNVVLGSVEDSANEAGAFAIGNYGGSQLVEKLEFLDLDSGTAEAWRELRSEPDNLELFRGAELTETGAKLPKSGYLLTRFDEKSIRDGAIRMKTAFGGPEIQARARSTDRGGYSLHVSSATTVLLSRWDSKEAKRSELKVFTIAKPFTAGQIYELELRVVGPELTAKLDGEVLGTAVDSALSSGRFGFGTSHIDARQATITAMQFLDLSGDRAVQAASAPNARDGTQPPGAQSQR